MQFSPLSHLIALGLIGWFYMTARRLDVSRRHAGAIVVLTTALVLWVTASTGLALGDFYFRNNAAFLPIALVSVLFVAMGVGAYGLSANVRATLDRLIGGLSRRQLAVLHIPRILAIGTVFKMLSGQLPVHFVGAAGVPDLLFGLSAIYVAFRADRLSDRAFVVWNGMGILVFLVALVTMQFSLPGPLHLVTAGPTTREVVSFPMSIVPTFVAPFFIGLNLMALTKVLRSRGTEVVLDQHGTVSSHV